MTLYHRNSERKRIFHDYRRQEEEVVGSLCRLGSRPISPKSLLEQEKRIRREIANSNERRRMQSINEGYQSLRALLPHREGEKLSKAAILQGTADYVCQLEQDKAHLQQKNNQLSRRMLNFNDSDGSCSDSPLPKRMKLKQETEFLEGTNTVGSEKTVSILSNADSSDEGIGSASPSRSDHITDDVRRENAELRNQLENERALRILLEKRLRNAQLFTSGGPDPVDHIPVDYDTVKSSMLSKNSGHESGLGSPQSQISSPDLESIIESSLRESPSPELPMAEIPEDLSEKNSNTSVTLPFVTRLSNVTTNIPEVKSSFPVEIIRQQAEYHVSTSRQNLETIVEAIRHLEGDHMFRDDPAPAYSESSHTQNLSAVDELCTEQSEHRVSSLKNRDFTIQNQIIRNAPLTQSRPGVIVSNLS